MPGTERVSRQVEIPREATPEAFPVLSNWGGDGKTVVVRVGLSRDDAVRLLSQLFPCQHSCRDHGNLLPS